MHVIIIHSPYHHGDVVEFKSKHNGHGIGKITDIAYCDDGSIYYGIEDKYGKMYFGIYPHDVIRTVDIIDWKSLSP